MKIRPTQPQVDFELGLSLAKILNSLKDTFMGTPFSNTQVTEEVKI
jgi:hypothetical protein